MNITQPESITCKKCGKRLPVTIVHTKGEAVILVWCRSCKTNNTIKMQEETKG